MLYGGIDSQEVTERAADPSGAMGAIQRILANDVACKHTLRDFARKPAERRLFPGIEPERRCPAPPPKPTPQIRRAIVHLHELMLGRTTPPIPRRSTRTFELFAGIVADAQERKGVEKLRELLTAGPTCPSAPRRSRTTPSAPGAACVTYLLRRQEFLYE